MPGVQQKAFTRLLEKQQQQQLSENCSYETVRTELFAIVSR